MKTKSKIIFSSVLLASLLAISAGNTYAIFKKNNNVVTETTSGKIDISASLSDLSYSGTGTVTISNNSIALTNLTIGDSVSFKLTYSNNSTVKIKYRKYQSYSDSNALLSDIVMNYGGEERNTTSNYYTSWSDEEFETSTVNVTISLPSSATGTYTDLSSTISFNIEATYQNRHTSDKSHWLNLGNSEEMENTISCDYTTSSRF